MATVLLPTRKWTPACEEVADQLDPCDELLLVCDTQDDPLAKRVSSTDQGESFVGSLYSEGNGVSDSGDSSATVEVLVAGEPQGCSGKANAIACGLEHSDPAQDRFIWTDGDFIHGDGWIDRMKALGEQQGAVSAVPVFVSDGGWVWRLFEPATAVCGSLSFYTQNRAWGGSVTFTRNQIDLDALIVDLRRTVSDDTLLWEYLGRGDSITTTRELVYEVPVPGGMKAALRRVVRFNKILYHFARDEVAQFLAIGLMFYVVTAVAPLIAAGLATAVAAGTYWFLGIRRWTFLFSFPAFLLMPIVLGYSILVDGFEWSGRRYYWPSKFEVTVERVAADESGR